ncbi:Uncharacterised protein [Candidatus Anstonella stagnisolia]|nr:Uncharacterised protein [Candidatus Anstonella stagnisolia]
MKNFVLVAILLLAFSFSLSFAQLGCNPGTTECYNTTAYRTCNAQALWDAPVSCGLDAVCSNGACQQMMGCQPGAKECTSDSTYRICNTYALWNPDATCPSGTTCKSGSCAPLPQCSQGQARCSPTDANMQQICNADLQWQNSRSCSYGCVSGTCRSCYPGSTQCSDNTHYERCGSDGTWGTDTYCGTNYVCQGGSCILNPAFNCNNVGTYRCSPSDSSTLQRCNSNMLWADYQSCQYGCQNSACRACISGQVKCMDGFTYYSCVAGQWGAPTSCPYGYTCQNGACLTDPGTSCSTRGQTRCSPSDSTKVQTCSQNYVYLDTQTCSLGCIGGTCAQCAQGSAYCSSSTSYRTCLPNGQLSDPVNCSAGSSCENSGQCVAEPQCTQGQRNCVANTIYTCTNGQWQTFLLCPQGTSCIEQQSTALCQPDAVPTPAPAPTPEPSPAPASKELGSFGAYFAIAAAVLAIAAYYFYTKKGKK